MTHDTILDWLTMGNWYTHELCQRCNLPEGDMLIALATLVQEGRARRLVSGAWALSMSEHNRRRRHKRDKPAAPRVSPSRLPTVMADPSPFPRPPYETPSMGWWG